MVGWNEVRKIYNDKLGYTLSDREKNAERLSKISKFLSDQKINVTSSVLSISLNGKNGIKRKLIITNKFT